MKNEEKARLRARFKEIRSALKRPERDAALLEQILRSPFFEKEKFFVYRSIGTEADTLQLIDRLSAADKRVLVPRVEAGRMLSVPRSEETELVFGIPQPREGEEEEAEVIFAPLLAFDEEGYRLGYGGGYYDAYFARRKGLRVGIAYAGQAVKRLPREPFDVKLDAVVTEAGVRYFT